MFALLLTACASQFTILERPTTLWNHFAFEEGRTWTYVSADPETSGTLVATREDDVETVDETAIYTVVYTYHCDAPCEDFERMRLRWSSASSTGVRIHSVAVDAGRRDFVPPLQIVLGGQFTGDTWVSPTGAGQWTSTYEGLAPCDTELPDEFVDCAGFTLAPEGLSDVLLPLTSFQAALGQGLVTIDLGAAERWRLADFDCGACDGVW